MTYHLTSSAKRHKSRRGDSIVLGELLLFAGMVAIGLALWGFSLSYVAIQSTKLTEDQDKIISQQRSFLVIEAVSLQSNRVWVSNHGLNDVAVISCTIYPKASPSPGIRHNVRGVIVRASDNRSTALTGCEPFPGQPPYIVEVWYVPAHLYNTQDLTRNSMHATVARYEKG